MIVAIISNKITFGGYCVLTDGTALIHTPDMVTGRQICAARAFLGWRRIDLACESGLSDETIKIVEGSRCSRSANPEPDTMRLIVDAFTRHGVAFTRNGGIAPISQ
jgi:hypothetical protein